MASSRPTSDVYVSKPENREYSSESISAAVGAFAVLSLPAMSPRGFKNSQSYSHCTYFIILAQPSHTADMGEIDYMVAYGDVDDRTAALGLVHVVRTTHVTGADGYSDEEHSTENIGDGVSDP